MLAGIEVLTKKKKGKVLATFLKDGKSVQCLSSCGSEFQMRGSKQENKTQEYAIPKVSWK